MTYLVGGTVDSKNVLFLGDDNSLTGSENLEEAKALLPNLNGHHKAGHTWSASATIWWMTFKPRLLAFADLAEVESALRDNKVEVFRNIAGAIRAVTLREDYTPNIVEHAPLMNEGIEDAVPFYER